MQAWSAMHYGMAVVCGLVLLLSIWATANSLKAQERKSGWKGYDPYQPEGRVPELRVPLK